MNILDVKARLSTLTAPVLLPEDRELPLVGRRPGQAGGLTAYLAANPNGYVQLYDASGLLSDTLTDTGFMRLEVVASTRLAAETLSDQVRALLGGTNVQPSPYRVYIPPQTIPQDGFVRVVTTYQTRSIGVQHVP
ncbi:hypothetical protein Q0M94_11935 [Deinococcus radiomollis]|uniref:hypothetical protein n=1 Tax=Deinococcus radiomollis TaxID=468916 RepID=UPI0038921F24